MTSSRRFISSFSSAFISSRSSKRSASTSTSTSTTKNNNNGINNNNDTPITSSLVVVNHTNLSNQTNNNNINITSSSVTTTTTTPVVSSLDTMTSHAPISSDEPLISTTLPPSDHESDASDDHDLYDPKCIIAADDNDDNDLLCGDGSCVVCFERPTNITFDPCGHANLCDVCVSRLVKRRCPTCRARAKRVTIRHHGLDPVTKAVRDVIAERKQRETRVLEDTLQIVFLGPEKVGKKTLVRKLIAKYPLVQSGLTSQQQQQQQQRQQQKQHQQQEQKQKHQQEKESQLWGDDVHSEQQQQQQQVEQTETGQEQAQAHINNSSNINNNQNNSNYNDSNTSHDGQNLHRHTDSQSHSHHSIDAIQEQQQEPNQQKEQVSSQPRAISNACLDESPVDVFGDGTDFSANATIAGCNVRLTVLRRTTLASRRMVLDDVRVLKPDVLVLCCSAHVGSTFDAIQTWDKVLRTNFQKPRVWALLTLDDSEAEMTTTNTGTPTPTTGVLNGTDPTVMGGPTTHSLDRVLDVNGAINAVFPPDVRPKGHYYWSRGESFSIGFRSLAKDIVSMGRLARSEEVVASYAAEARHFADHNHVPISSDTNNAANFVLANSGIAVAANSISQPQGNNRSNGSRSGPHVGRSFSWRGLRDRNGHGPGIIWSGLVNWLAGSHES